MLTILKALAIIKNEERTTHAVALSRFAKVCDLHHRASRHLAEWRLFFLRCVSLMTIVTVYFPMWKVIRIRITPFREDVATACAFVVRSRPADSVRLSSDAFILHDSTNPCQQPVILFAAIYKPSHACYNSFTRHVPEGRIFLPGGVPCNTIKIPTFWA